MDRDLVGHTPTQTEQPMQSMGLTAREYWYRPLPLPALKSTILAHSGAFLASSASRAKGRMVAWGQT